MEKRKQKSLLKLEAKISKDVFMLFLALNALGYNDENNNIGMHPVRKKVRNILKKYNWDQKYLYLNKIFKKTDPWYLLHTLFEKNKKKLKHLKNVFFQSSKNLLKKPQWKNYGKTLKIII